MSKCRRHDSLIGIVSEEMQKRGWKEPHKNTEYKKGEVAGEIDLYFKKGNYVFAFEMKSQHSNKKEHVAQGQLDRMAEHYFSPEDRVFKLYATYNSPKRQDYTIRWLK